jgi:hypothetical protein
MDKKLKYVEIQPKTRAELEAAFASDDEDIVCNAMYSAAQHEPDWRWTQGKLLESLKRDSLLIRSAALIALGELALFRGRVDLELVLPEVHKLKGDPALAPFAEDCLKDIKIRTTLH